jgi:hypothetical protein
VGCRFKKATFAGAQPHSIRAISRRNHGDDEMTHIEKPTRSRRTRTAYSLLEVVLASTICLTALAPALALMRDGMANASKIDTRHRLLICGVSKMEEQLAIVAASWTTGTASGDFTADGAAGIRFAAVRSDAPASGGITNRLMNISVTVYSDDNGNAALDATELQSTFTTKVGKLVNYATMAGS